MKKNTRTVTKKLDDATIKRVVLGQAGKADLLQYRLCAEFDVVLQSVARIDYLGIDAIVFMRIMKFGSDIFHVGIQKTEQGVCILWNVIYDRNRTCFIATDIMDENFRLHSHSPKKKPIADYILKDIILGRATKEELYIYKSKSIFSLSRNVPVLIKWEGIERKKDMTLLSFGRSGLFTGLQKTKQGVYVLWNVAFQTQDSEYVARNPSRYNFERRP